MLKKNSARHAALSTAVSQRASLRTAAFALTLGLGWSMSGGVAAMTLKISCSALGQEAELCKKAANEWGKKTGNEVQIVATPNDGSERLGLYQQILAAKSDKIDVFQIDVAWPGILGAHLLDLKPYSKGGEKDHFSSMVGNNLIGNRLVAMPWFVDAGLLYYRKDLLEKYKLKVPGTWQELADGAKKIQEGERSQGNKLMWGYVWQGRSYEGLTCNALEWLFSYDGGSIVESTGRVSVNNPAAAKALQGAASWVGSISPTAVLNYAEEESRGVWQAGNAAFMRNWPYAWALAQKEDSVIKGKVGVAALPKGGESGRRAATLGGQLLAVSKYSANADLAADLVMYMTSAEVQKDRALKGAFNPTIGHLYKDKEILSANPFMGELYFAFASAVARPATVTASRYNQVSNEFANTVHEVLSGKAEAGKALSKLESALQRIGQDGKWQ